MHPETEYYQIGGFRAHSNSWFRFDEKALIRAITSSRSPALRPSNDGIELVLGVLRSGATYVLMSREQMLSFTRLAGLRPSNSSWHSSAFISLSPISFSTAEEFTKKIQSYRQKSNKHREGEIQDNSPANKGYIKAVNLDGGIPRSAFEHQRVLYRILKGKLEIHKFGLKETPWATAIRVVSFAFTPWTRDTRPYPIRLKKPQLLDVGWTELDLPIYLSTGRVNDTAHIRVKENRILGNPGSSKGNFQYGDSEMLDDSSIPSRIQKLMSHDEQSRDVPLVILVYNEKMARGVFAHYGIDTAYWESGISELLELDSSKYDSQRRRDRSRSRSPRRARDSSSMSHRDYDYKPVKREDNDAREYLYHSPSRSPQREKDSSSLSRRDYDNRRVKNEDQDEREYLHRPLSRSPQRERNSSSASRVKQEDDRQESPRHRAKRYAPAYVVDVEALCKTMMQSASVGVDITSTARRLGLQTARYDKQWCAGNECHLLVDMWSSMAEGVAIDEQRALRSLNTTPDVQDQPTVTAPAQTQSGNSDNEQDPNARPPQQQQQQQFDPTDDWEDDY